VSFVCERVYMSNRFIRMIWHRPRRFYAFVFRCVRVLCVCACVFVIGISHIYIQVIGRMYVFMYVHIYVYIYICMYVCMYVLEKNTYTPALSATPSTPDGFGCGASPFRPLNTFNAFIPKPSAPAPAAAGPSSGSDCNE